MLYHRSKWGLARGDMQAKRRKIGTCKTGFNSVELSRKSSARVEISETKEECNKNDVTT